MNQEETGRLLGFVAAFDHRNPQDADADIMAWHAVLHEQPLQDCKEAVVRFFKTEKGWIMPGDVFRLARHVRADRAREADKQRALAAAPAGPDLEHADIRRRIMDTPEFKAKFERGKIDGNAERAYNVKLRETGSRDKAAAAYRAVREAAGL